MECDSRKLLTLCLLISLAHVIRANDQVDIDYSTLKLYTNESERELRQWFGLNPTAPPSKPIVLNGAEFDEIARRVKKGIPFIVSDALPYWPAMQWSCEHFKHRFANEYIEAFGVAEGEVERKYSDDYLSEETDSVVNASGLSSWYWYPIRAGYSPLPKHLAELQNDLQLPYFLEQTDLNRMMFNNRLEIFTGKRGQGVPAHTDMMCNSIYSGQVSGEKRWRLAMFPDDTQLASWNDGFTYVDERDRDDIADRIIDEVPLYSWVQKPGDLVFFPPGMLHSTEVVSDACSLSFSLQFADPSPTSYITRFGSVLARDRMGASSCFHQVWNVPMYATYDGPDRAHVAEWADTQFSKVVREARAQSEHAITLSEAHRFMVAHDKTVFMDLGAYCELANLPYSNAKAFIAFNDASGDGVVSRVEFAAHASKFTQAMAEERDYWVEDEAKYGFLNTTTLIDGVYKREE